MNAFATVILVAACLSAYVCGESHFVCKQMEEVFSSQSAPSGSAQPYRNRPGKRGVEGRKGEIGRTGPKGDRGIVEYDLVNKTIKEYIGDNQKENNQKILSLEASLAAVNEKLRRVLAISLQGCAIAYNNKCYVPETEATRNIDGARDICTKISGKLADIDDKTQLNHLMKTIRSSHLGGRNALNFWTGMTINPENGKVKFLDGSTAPALQWYPGYPKTNAERINIGITVQKSSTSSNQYMWNVAPANAYFPLCEI